MGNTNATRNVSTSDRDDPINYVDFDSYVAGASSVYSLQGLTQRWNSAHPEALVRPQGEFLVPTAARNTDGFRDCGTTRIFAALQLVGGGLEVIVAGGALLAPEPTGLTKVVGTVVLLHGVDTLQASVRTLLTCDRTQLPPRLVRRRSRVSPARAPA